MGYRAELSNRGTGFQREAETKSRALLKGRRRLPAARRSGHRGASKWACLGPRAVHAAKTRSGQAQSHMALQPCETGVARGAQGGEGRQNYTAMARLLMGGRRVESRGCAWYCQELGTESLGAPGPTGASSPRVLRPEVIPSWAARARM